MAFFCKQSMLFRVLFFLGLIALAFASASAKRSASLEPPPTYLRHQRRALENSHHHKRQNASSFTQARNASAFDIAQAQKIVPAAVVQQGEYNTYRVANPRLNKYYSSNSDEAKASRKQRRDSEPVPPTLSTTVRAAAALLAEHSAAAQAENGTLHRIYNQPKSLPRFDDNSASSNTKRATSDYWVGSINHRGLAPMGANSSWLVYRDVTNPMFAGGAKGDGVTDDTAAINAAIAHGGNSYYYSQLVGDANDIPIIKTSASFIGLGAIETDVYVANSNGGE
ncbi:MAG: hypothetical protein M1818_003467 [Claussenomyces sp. TS43310]|nr:MAG: hypothetical protein M1818_003467 [Claussenomyces sp. TS43310]